MIDSYLLEQLIAFHECGTLSAAADKLLISQPALSQSMKKIEDLVGVPLFIRSKNKTSFNDNGLLLLDYAQKIAKLQEEMIKAVQRQASHQSSLHLASIAPAPLSKLLPQVEADFPDMTVTSQLLTDGASMLEDLQADCYDLVITRSVPEKENLIALPFFTERLHMVVPSNHPLAKLDVISSKALDGQNILLLSEIGFWLDLVKQNLPQSNFLYMDNSRAFTNLAMVGDFPTFGTDAIQAPPLENRKLIPIEEDFASAQFYFVTKQENLYKWQRLIESNQE